MANGACTPSPRRVPSLGLTRAALSTGLTTAAVFLFCWAGALVSLQGPTHAYVSLFTRAPVNSAAGLLEGAIWSFLFGAITGGLFAMFYSLAAFCDRTPASPMEASERK